MSRVLQAGADLALAAWIALLAGSSRAQVVPGQPDAGGMPAPTAVLERGRTVYVLNTCHFCHGVDLTKATMGAAVLMHSALVGADENGNVIGAIARAGIPNLQTSMPSYPDLTQQEVEDLAALHPLPAAIGPPPGTDLDAHRLWRRRGGPHLLCGQLRELPFGERRLEGHRDEQRRRDRATAAARPSSAHADGPEQRRCGGPSAALDAAGAV